MLIPNTFKKLLALLCLVLATTLSYSQTTYYFVGGDGTTADFTTGTAWSISLGGTPVGGTITPSATTNYIIDGADVSSTSGAQTGTTVTLTMAATRTIGTFTVINNSITVSLTGVNFDLICGDVTINSGCILNNQTEIKTGGNLLNNGTLTYGGSSGEFTFTGLNKTISGSGTTNFRKFTIETGAYTTLQCNVGISGALVSFVNANGTLDASTYLITEIGNITSSISLTGTLRTANPTGVRGVTGATVDPNITLTMQTGNTVEFYAPNGTQDVWCGNSIAYYNNVIISGGGTKRLVNAAATWIDIRGSLTINTGATLDASGTGDATNIKNIEFDVNFTNNGTFTARTGRVIVAGSGGTQVLTMNSSSLYDLELGNPTSNAASLGSDATLTHYLYFTNGRLLLGNYNFTFGLNADKAPASTPSNLKMLVTNGNGEVKKIIPAGGQQFTYFVGEITGTGEYSPVTLNFTANSAERTFGTRVVDAQHPNDGTVTSYISRYWHFSETSAPGNYIYDATFTFLAADLVGPFAPMSASYIYLPNTTWTGIASTALATSIAVTGTSQSLFNAEVTGRVTVGCTPPTQPAAFTASSASVCTGQTGVTYTVPNDPNVTYNWSYTGTNTIINGTSNSVTLDFGANATGGTLSVTAVNVCSSTPRTIAITITPPVSTPTFSAGATTLCVGAISTYTASATNSTGIVYSIVGGVGASINPSTGAVSNVTGNFTVRATATGTCGSPTTADRVVTVTPTVGTPTFSAGATTLCTGGTSTYAASASNSTGITYSIVGGVGASINPSTGVVSNVTGNFTVRATATGTCGNPTTADRAVSVTNSLTISQQPQTQTACFNAEVTFTVVAGGSNMQYQWQLDGVDIPNATSASYTVIANPNNGGDYTVSITSSCGNATSNVATLTVNPVIIVFNSATICNGDTYTFQGVEYTDQGTYYDTLQSSAGCDSIETLELTVTTLNPVVTVSNNVNLNTGTFDDYQWLLNGTPIGGAVNQNYTATQNGSYSVVVSDGNCSDTSNVIVINTIGVDELLASISIYPNPTNNVLYIKTSNIAGNKLSYILYDITGRKLEQKNINNTNQELNLTGYLPGVYMLTITNAAGQNLTHRIVKAE